MRRWSVRLLCWLVVVFAWSAAPAPAHHDFNDSGTSADFTAGDDFSRMGLQFGLPNTTGAVNSDMAFWGDRAFVGNYNGIRIFDISNPASPALLADFQCFGPQNDVSVWDRDGNGDADLMITSVDRTLTGPQCGATATAHELGDPRADLEVHPADDAAGRAGVVVLHERLRDRKRLGHHAGAVGLGEEAALVADDLRLDQDGTLQAGRDALHGAPLARTI